MSTLVAPTAGFGLNHIYEGPELERALEICHAINAFALEEFDLATADPATVRDLSLREMLDAVDMVMAWNDRPRVEGVAHSISFVPAERLIAAVYTLVNFAARSPCGDADDDHIPVRCTQRQWGTDYVHFLAVGNRRKSQSDDAEDES